MEFVREVARLETLINEMEAADHIDDYKNAWEEFLYRLERAWGRTEQAYKNQKWFQKLFAPYRKLRKREPVLKYLKNARNAETHTLQGTLSSSLNIALRDKCGRGFSADRIHTSFVDGCLTINVDTLDIFLDLYADVGRGTPSLTEFRSRKDWYKPPRTYLGGRLSSNNPVVVAKLGLEMFRSLVEEIDEQSHNKSFQLTGKSAGS